MIFHEFYMGLEPVPAKPRRDASEPGEVVDEEEDVFVRGERDDLEVDLDLDG